MIDRDAIRSINMRFERVLRTWRRGFSLVEFLMVIVIVVVLVGIFVPYFSHIRETDRRARCADNLRKIMDGLRQYASVKDAKGKATHSFPSTIHDRKTAGYVAYTGAESKNPFSKDTLVKPNDVTASLWLLVRGGWNNPSHFVCPSSRQYADPKQTNGQTVPADQRSNFSSGNYLSYSYASPFSTAPGYKMNEDSHDAEFAIMADKNPGAEGKSSVIAPAYNAAPFDLARANSRNHGRVGQNVLYADGHVSWQTTPYCGVGSKDRRDNIFTALSPSPLPIKGPQPPNEINGCFGRDIGPSWTNDSYLVPAEGD